MAAGVTPGIRAAWPKVPRAHALELATDLARKPRQAGVLKLVSMARPSARRNLSTWRSCCRTYPPYFASISILERTPRAGSSPTRQWPRPLTEAPRHPGAAATRADGAIAVSEPNSRHCDRAGTGATQQFHQPGLVLLLPREQRPALGADQPDAMARGVKRSSALSIRN